MRWLPLLLANLRRKKLRTVLTIGSFAVAMCLFGVLAAVRSGFRQGIDIAGADRMIVMGRSSFMEPLPVTYADRLKRVPGVKDVAHATWFGGVYQDPKNFFAQFAVDPESWRVMYPEFQVDASQWTAFLTDRQGCIVGAKLAQRFGWKVGDRIPLRPPVYFGEGSWDFNVRGIYHGTRQKDDESQFWFQHRYLYEKAPEFWRTIVGWYMVRVANPDQAAAVAKAIDETFANSAKETRTQSESAFAAGFVKQMGNIEFLLLAVGAVVFFTLLLVTGNTMAIAVRERTNDLAVLKAIGYSDPFVLVLVLAESVLIAAVGGAIGLWWAHAIVKQDLTRGLLLLYLPATAMLAGALLALLTGFVAGVIPAVTAMRLSVVEALRRV